MQQVNLAYERNDLSALLALQMESEQINADQWPAFLRNACANLGSRHYLAGGERCLRDNEILNEQLRTLERELEVDPLRMDFGLDISWRHKDFESSSNPDLQSLDDPRRALFESSPGLSAAMTWICSKRCLR